MDGMVDGRGQALVQTARQVLPGGSLGNMDGDAIIQRGKAGRVWDMEGREYVDLLLGSGPMLVGHAHPEVTAAAHEQIALGTTFFANNEHSIRLAEAIVDAVPCAEQVRYTSSGTEADSYAMRLARAFRRRDKILKFEGGYHGMSDYAMMSLWPAKPGNFPLASIDSAGIPANTRDNVLVAPYNDLQAVQDLIRANHDELAGVIVEPMQRLVSPVAGFLQGLREITAQYGIPLIFDEVVTGFRLAYGGGQTYYGVTPDLCTMGKVIGGGFPLAAVAGRADIMAHFDRAIVGEAGFTPQIGTLSGNPVAAAAGLATLAVLRQPGAYERIFANGNAIRTGLEKALRDAGFAVQVPGEPPMFDALFTANPVQDYRSTLAADAVLSKRFNALVRERGVFKSAGKIYISLAHDEVDIAQAIEAFTGAAQALRASLP
ncbi:aspartate aminotransferase family protein [Acidisphaera sp. L21]|uniref:aspartate aminotransferase family protein n=1 Tax=Acidisphaera sp. L21 TaxID=1641851 RepID=UPI001C201929|nr:aminotransferase class III-fold pyridoxal phosphate-dependent enzyme [Acidisphaera sp. L21]